jgi:hypothetical protein
MNASIQRHKENVEALEEYLTRLKTLLRNRMREVNDVEAELTFYKTQILTAEAAGLIEFDDTVYCR